MEQVAVLTRTSWLSTPRTRVHLIDTDGVHTLCGLDLEQEESYPTEADLLQVCIRCRCHQLSS